MVRRFLRLQAVEDATGWSKSTIYEKIKQGKFPAPVKMDPDGKAVGWFDDVVEAVQKRAVAAPRGAAPALAAQSPEASRTGGG